MPRSVERKIRIGAAGFIFVELVRSALGIGGAESASAKNAKFREYLLPENRQVQQLSASEMAELQNSNMSVDTGSVENAVNSERLGQLAGYVQNVDIGDGRVTSNYYDLEGNLVSRQELTQLMEENIFQIIPLGAPVRVGNVTLLPPDDGEWRLIEKQPSQTVAEAPQENVTSPEAISSSIVAYANDQELGQGDGSVSTLFYSPDGQLMSAAEVDALLEQGDFVVRPVNEGTTFTSGQPLPGDETWYSVQLQTRHGSNVRSQDDSLGVDTSSMDSTDGIALAMHVVSEPGDKVPPDDDGDGEEDGSEATGTSEDEGGGTDSGDASQVPSGEQDGEFQEGGNNKPLEVAFVDSYLLEHAASPAEAQWMALSAEDQRALAVYFQMSGVTNLEGGTIQPGDLGGDVAQGVTVNGVPVFRVQLVPSGAFDFYLPQGNGTMLHVTTEAEFLEAVAAPVAPAEVAANWLSAPAGERATVETAPALLEVMNNPDAEIPPVQVTSWSVMDFSQMPDELIEAYSNYSSETTERLASEGNPMETTSFVWEVVPDARAMDYLNSGFPEQVQNLPADGEVKYVTPEGEVVITTTGAMRELAPQIITEVVGEEKLREIPESAWNIGESMSTAVEYDSATNVATVYLVSPDVFDPYSATITRMWQLANISVFTSDPQSVLEDISFNTPVVPEVASPQFGVDIISSDFEFELLQKAYGSEFQFQPVVNAS